MGNKRIKAGLLFAGRELGSMNIKRLFPAVAGLALLGFAAPHALAWNGTGHMVAADIAYDHLTPKTKAGIDALLQKHRDYALWMREMPTGYTDKGRWAFMKASTWPDEVRKTPDDRPTWHYIDLPVVAPGYAPDTAAIRVVTPNAETQIGAETALLTAKTASDGERAVALCWVEHLVGDIHQPLHDSALFSAQFPHGDRGGNDETLAPNAVDADPLEAAANPHKLHALWDDLLGATQDPVEIAKIAASLETPAYGRSTFPQLALHKTVHEWAQEGNILAQRDAYVDETLPMTAIGEGKAEVTLPPRYLTTAHQIADRQVALAGLRLADTLNAQKF